VSTLSFQLIQPSLSCQEEDFTFTWTVHRISLRKVTSAVAAISVRQCILLYWLTVESLIEVVDALSAIYSPDRSLQQCRAQLDWLPMN